MALDRNTGRVLWRYSTGTGEQRRNVVAGPTVEGRLLLASDHFGNGFFSVDRFTGQEVWRVEGQPGFFGPDESPVVVEGIAYLASNDLQVYAFEPQTGRVLWKTRTEASNRAFAVCRNRIFTNDHFLAMLDRASGKILATKFDSSAEFLTSGFAVHEDRVFVVGNKAAYAFRCA
ncbi:hypothetical protein BH23GEM3_BH23GEM3_11660 [soil metagenome]|nr:PQQ-binding-like beta-propeller repeat protein [Gemmatimonadota bacterium]